VARGDGDRVAIARCSDLASDDRVFSMVTSMPHVRGTHDERSAPVGRSAPDQIDIGRPAGPIGPYAIRPGFIAVRWQRVQMLSRCILPLSISVLRWTLGLKSRFVRRFEKLTL